MVWVRVGVWRSWLSVLLCAVVAVLGVLQTGAAYVPIVGFFAGADRVCVGDAAPVVAVCTAGSGSRVGDAVPVIEVDDPAVGVQPVTAPGVVAAVRWPM